MFCTCREINFADGLPDTIRRVELQIVKLGLKASGLKTQLTADCAVGAFWLLMMMTIMRHFRWTMRAFVINLASDGTRLKNDGHPRNQENAENLPSPEIALPTDC